MGIRALQTADYRTDYAGYSAFYSDQSTEKDPIIRVSSNYGGEQRYYDVHVNDVDPRNASQLDRNRAYYLYCTIFPCILVTKFKASLCHYISNKKSCCVCN